MRFHFPVSLLAMILLASVLPAAADPPPPAPANSDVLVLKRMPVHDEMAQIDAGTILVPDGWKLDASVEWTMTVNKPAGILLKLSDPKSPEAITLYPEGRYMDGFRQYMANAAARLAGPQAGAQQAAKFPDGVRVYGTELRTLPNTPADFVTRYFIPKTRPDLARARLLETKDEPDLAKAVALLHANDHATVQVNLMRYQYAINGVDCEEDLCCIIASAAGGNGTTNWSGAVQSCEGPLNQVGPVVALSRTVVASFQINPEWFAKVQAVQQLAFQVARQGQDAQAQRAAILAKAQAQINDTMRQQMQYSQKLQAKSYEAWDQVARQVEPQYDQNSGQNVEIPLDHSNAWSSPNGAILATSNSAYDPNSRGGGPWTKLGPAKEEQ
jgi:hypothetical protein